MAWNFELLEQPYGAVSEGPVWHESSLLYTQIQACRIMRYVPKTQKSSVSLDNTNYANGLAMDSQNCLCACEGGARRVVRYEADGSTTVLADQFEGKQFNIPNDLVFDQDGDIWFTDPFYEGSAGPFSFDLGQKELDHDSIYKINMQSTSERTIQRMTFDTTRPNGLLFSLDFQTLYVAQSGRRADEKRELRAYHLQQDGSLDTGTVLHDFGEHRGIDGMCLDQNGNIVATAGWELGGPGPSIYVFGPEGNVLERHPVPANRPTNCAFGGNRLSDLYVTSTEGHLFRAQTDRHGHPGICS